MAKRKNGQPEENLVPRHVARKMLLDLREKARAMLQESITATKISTWETLAQDYLSRSFGTHSPNTAAVMDVGRYRYMGAEKEEDRQKERAEDMEERISQLDVLIELVEGDMAMQGQPLQSGLTPGGKKVFLVHGHDERAIHETARFLEKLKVEVIVLREQPNKGRTIIEKFHDFADVVFAVVLLTPDDRGGTAATPFDQQKPRARQNVILELGFFLGALKRSRVCVLYHEGVEVPSDYSGVLFVPVDSKGAWKMELAKEMKAAELPIDLNNAL